MNVIENLLKTNKYKNVKAILDMKKALLELIDYEIDMSNKNAPHDFKSHIDKTLRDIVRNIPYSLSVDKISIPSRWFDDLTNQQGVVHRTDSGHFEPRVVTTIDTGSINGDSISINSIDATSISDLVHRPNRGPNPYLSLTQRDLSADTLYTMYDGTISSRSSRRNETDDK